MKISLLSLGCKVNQAEIAEIESSLKGQGHHIVGLDEKPDIAVINTCTVTAKSDYQSRQLIRRAQRAGARVMVTGCYSELNLERVAGMEGVEKVISNSNKTNIINIIESTASSNTFEMISPNPHSATSPPLPPMEKEGRGDLIATGRTRYFLKVQDGCNNSCNYCLIPRARGTSRSIGMGDVIEKVEAAVSAGYKEIVLTGIHLGHYGLDIGWTLPDLIEEIILKTQIDRIRLSSLEVNEINDRLLDIFNSGRLCRHLHIPLQSGSDKVLFLMNRRYNTRFFKEILCKVAARLDNIFIGTDIIAGHPGEGELEFQSALDFIRTLPFCHLHVFPFSGRPGTKSAVMAEIAEIDGSIDDSIIKRRVSILRSISSEKTADFTKANIGKTLDVLLERRVDGGLWQGLSGNYLKILVPAGPYDRGSIVSVRVEGIENGRLFGKPCF